MIWLAIISLLALSVIFITKGRKVTKLTRKDGAEFFTETTIWVIDRISKFLGVTFATFAMFLTYIALS